MTDRLVNSGGQAPGLDLIVVGLLGSTGVVSLGSVAAA